MTELRFRQIHLDFHTSEAIADIGAQFDPEEFADTLARARVNSVTCFAKCHHGWLYYDSQEFPQLIHPHLANRNLLPEQIAACHARDIRVPIYITVQVDFHIAKLHPEWCIITPQGAMTSTPYTAGFWRLLCLNSPYREWLARQTVEVLDSMPVDGLFFDILSPRDCSCRHCLDAMQNRGIDPTNAEARMAFAIETLHGWKAEMSALVRQRSPQATIFYNAGHVGPRLASVKDAYSHFELESLPTGGWGYIHFPLSIRYARNHGLDCLGMTGKFHTSWGDFHSFKTREALEFECFHMLAQGAKCSIGDQLPPSGKLDAATYDLIGSVYEQVEAREPWCAGAAPVADIGVFTPEEFDASVRIDQALAGAVQLLQESGHQFDVIDSNSPFQRYRLLILPDRIPVDRTLARKLQRYLDRGGALLASFESGLTPDGEDFGLAALGVQKIGDGPRDEQGKLVRGRMMPGHAYAEYIIPRGAIGRGLPRTEHVMYMRGLEVKAAKGARTLARVTRSHFDRTWEHFCSHRQTPSSGKSAHAAIVQSGRAIYFGHPVFLQFHQNGPAWVKTMVLNAIDMLMPERTASHNGPSSLLITVSEQKAQRRRVVHLLHYIPERRCQDMDVIRDVIPLFDVELTVESRRKVKSVSTAPQGAMLDFDQAGSHVHVRVPEIRGHQMVVLQC